jgi:hypothetical protein
METERLSLAVDAGTGAIITRLAGGERRRGQWISELVRAIDANQSVGDGADIEMLRLGQIGLAATQKMHDARLARLEAQRISHPVGDLRALVVD